ncbi:MAG: excinuclease ABC subunit UvrB [Thermodesulfobacteriota bacterium]
MCRYFKLTSNFEPRGDQPAAIDKIVEGINNGITDQVLLGVTGSGKTYTIANVINKVRKPALILAHNKTLAAQLFSEIKEYFPDNEVHYFVSYYDYYQPEAYIPETDTYIEKDASINQYIDRLRHAATTSLFDRRDVVIVASVSSIYGIGSPSDYYGMLTILKQGQKLSREELLRKLTEVQYTRKISELERGTFRVRGDTVDIFPSDKDSEAYRVEFFGDEVEKIKEIDPLSGKTKRELLKVTVFPGSHYVAPKEKLKDAIKTIKEELEERLIYFEKNNMELEKNRLRERTIYDIELLETMGFCPGIENYSRHISGRKEGEAPYTLLDYFPDDFLCIIDESHQMLPQIRGMYLGDRSRKQSLVENGFRLPSALDNRPLSFEEFIERIGQVIYVSATPADYEIIKSKDYIIEQIIRPTGLQDPEIVVKPATNQVDDLLDEIQSVIEKKERVLITTLTKRMAEDLTAYYREIGLRVRYLHSDIETLERIKIVRDLRLGEYDLLVGINMLREGLDIPEVSLVAILDADKEGFLRSESSLIQTFGRAARNVNGKVILYADTVTNSMKRAISETNRRKNIQIRYNKENNITPVSIKKNITNILNSIYEADYITVSKDFDEGYADIPPDKISLEIKKLFKEMKRASKKLEYEKAAENKKKIRKLREMEVKYLEDNEHK